MSSPINSLLGWQHNLPRNADSGRRLAGVAVWYIGTLCRQPFKTPTQRPPKDVVVEYGRVTFPAQDMRNLSSADPFKLYE